MTSIQKFYFHASSSAASGTLPSTMQGAVDHIIDDTNHSMDGTIGVSQVQVGPGTTNGTQNFQTFGMGRFVSSPLLAHTFTQTTDAWQLHGAGLVSNANANQVAQASVYMWRPSTGALVQFIIGVYTSGALSGQPAFGTSETVCNDSTGLRTQNFPTFTSQDGDVLVCEYVSGGNPTMSQVYTTNVFYDGTTENSAVSNAAYVLAPVALDLQPPLPLPEGFGEERVLGQAVKRGAFFCLGEKWARPKRAGLWVPSPERQHVFA